MHALCTSPLLSPQHLKLNYTSCGDKEMNHFTVFAEERLNGLTGLYDVWSGKSHENIK